jgi:hypothetical protein
VAVLIMLEYGDEQMIPIVIDCELFEKIMQIGNDHVLVVGMFQVHENGDCW